MNTRGGFGRRLQTRREITGLSIGELAERSAVDPDFLRYLEKQIELTVEPALLLRLAHGLDIAPELLIGDPMDEAPGQTRPRPESQLVALDASECRRLVGERGVGRVLFNQSRGPVALPVNYVAHVNDVVFRTVANGVLVHAIGSPVGFEVDRISDDLSEGWSVLYTGDAFEITDPGELSQIATVAPEPWADGTRDVCIRIAPTAITGRRIVPGPSEA
ncbi:MAG: hypothetical protein JWL70_1338 [Acidimicrobiia bacterium]|nr:hypothetical protein [Acidimicrobiia bacterium]